LSAEGSTSEYPFAVPGTVLVDKYRVDRVLGQGGMGIVVAATHLQLNQQVALKFLLPQAYKAPEAVARFMREAQAAARLRSEHAGHVTDVAKLPDGTPYMVMEFLDGGDLSRVLEQRGRLPIPEAVGHILQACEAVAEAHSFGIVHRDLKPANLFLTHCRDGAPLLKVLDFGISKSLGDTAQTANLTGTSVIIGSPQYMSPEQVRSSKHVDTRTDIWSLGVILHELLTGRVPFSADTMSALLVQIAVDPPQPLGEGRPDIPPELARIVADCLEKDPARRIQTVGELARRLAPFAPSSVRAGMQRTMTVSEPVAWPAAGADAQSAGLSPIRPTTAGWGNTRQPGTSRKPLIALLAVAGALTLLLAAGLGTLLRSRAASSPALSAATSAARQPAPLPTLAETATAAASASAVASATELPQPASAPKPPPAIQPRAKLPGSPQPRPTHVGGHVDPLDDRR
jgi:serine/threonine-protein kinase